MDEAIEVIIGEFSTWVGCELHSIAYSSDEFCNDSNIAWMNELEEADDAGKREDFTQCIMFTGSFHTPKYIPVHGTRTRNTQAGSGGLHVRRADSGSL